MLTMRAARPSGLACMSSGMLEALLIEGKRCAGGEQKAAAALLPASGDEWKHRDGARGCAAVLAALDAVVEPNGRGSAAIASGTAVGECESFDGVDAEAGDGGDALRRVLGAQSVTREAAASRW